GDLDLLDGSRSGPQVSPQKADGARHAVKLRALERAGPGLRPARAASHTRRVRSSSQLPPHPGPQASRRRCPSGMVSAAAAAALPNVLDARTGAAEAPALA